MRIILLTILACVCCFSAGHSLGSYSQGFYIHEDKKPYYIVITKGLKKDTKYTLRFGFDIPPNQEMWLVPIPKQNGY